MAASVGARCHERQLILGSLEGALAQRGLQGKGGARRKPASGRGVASQRSNRGAALGSIVIPAPRRQVARVPCRVREKDT